ncbi:hypothetical protein WHR41_00074 [Cladosporium halotolerans]|uniref:J domain-containing protein n=1 Tax=Cladosporium halotolerans TaxID=1052096 RepID=A0AB34L3M8_9PEZI
MGSPLPPDPYLALGLPRDAAAATIKTTYRKLILKFHPDKVQDAAQKQIASDQFHKIQTAYEIIGDDDRRARYDAQVKLAELKKEVMEKQSGGAGAQSEVRASGYTRTRHESPVRAPNYTARGADRSERVHVEERRPYDAETEYFDRPRTAARKDYEYERPSSKRPTPKSEKERARASRQSAKEYERARQKEKTKQSSRDTRKDRDYKYAYVGPETASSSESDAPVETPRQSYTRREEEDRRREREAYYEQVRRQKEDVRPYNVEERARKMQSDESNAREYIQRSRGASRQYPEPVRRPSPPRVSSKDKVEYIKRGDGRPAVMVRRGSGKPRPAERESEETSRRESPRRERERTRRSSHDYGEPVRKTPPLPHTKSAPGQIHLPGETPRRAYSMQVEAEEKDDFSAPPFRRADSMPQPSPRRERESSRKTQKASGLRRTETTDALPTPGATPEPINPQSAKSPYEKAYADDNEYPTPNGYRTEVHEPASGARGKVTRSPSPMNTKEERGRTASSRYPATPSRPPLSSARTTSYVYTPQGLQDMPARPSPSRNESHRRDHLYGEIPTTSSRSSPRQTRSKYSPPGEEVRYQQFRPEDVKVQTGYSSRRGSEMRPGYGRTNSYTTQAAY